MSQTAPAEMTRSAAQRRSRAHGLTETGCISPVKWHDIFTKIDTSFNASLKVKEMPCLKIPPHLFKSLSGCTEWETLLQVTSELLQNLGELIAYTD
uniref:Uncharacterized protein n=1 Tax=Anguilla anguilla TaxID=7936 RepID=A0A0E9WB33_ANGAN